MMPAIENIEGQKLRTLIDTLVREKTLVHISVPRHEYKRLTLITTARENRKTPIFQIDTPEGLLPALKQANAMNLHFEFTSSDRVAHRFDSQIKKVSKRGIWVAYPPFIQRHQMRENFRIKLMQESHARFCIDDIELHLPIDNISMGGIYCFCPNTHKHLFALEAGVSDMDLYFTHKEECYIIQVALARIKRMESHVRPRHFGMAFEFLRISNAFRRRLTQLIYELQREFLQQRLK